MNNRQWFNRRFNWDRRPISLVMTNSAAPDEQCRQYECTGHGHSLLRCQRGGKAQAFTGEKSREEGGKSVSCNRPQEKQDGVPPPGSGKVEPCPGTGGNGQRIRRRSHSGKRRPPQVPEKARQEGGNEERGRILTTENGQPDDRENRQVRDQRRSGKGNLQEVPR